MVLEPLWPVTQILADGHFRPGKGGCNKVELSLQQAYSASPNASLATLDGSFCRLLQGHSPRPHAPAPSSRSSTRTICVGLFAGRPRSRLMSLLAKSAGPSGARPLQHSEAPLHAEAGLEAGECVDRLVGLPHPRMKEVWEIPRMRRRGGGGSEKNVMSDDVGAMCHIGRKPVKFWSRRRAPMISLWGTQTQLRHFCHIGRSRERCGTRRRSQTFRRRMTRCR